jgi:hypothetical protein
MACCQARASLVDSQYYVTDPDVEHIPVEDLLSKVGRITFLHYLY